MPWRPASLDASRAMSTVLAVGAGGFDFFLSLACRFYPSPLSVCVWGGGEGSGGAMMLDKPPVPGRPTNLD